MRLPALDRSHQISATGGAFTVGSHVWGVYSKVPCIKGKSHMEPPSCEQKHDWNHYLPATSLVGGKIIQQKGIDKYRKIQFYMWFSNISICIHIFIMQKMLPETGREIMCRVFPNVLHPGTSNNLFVDTIETSTMGCENATSWSSPPLLTVLISFHTFTSKGHVCLRCLGISQSGLVYLLLGSLWYLPISGASETSQSQMFLYGPAVLFTEGRA